MSESPANENPRYDPIITLEERLAFQQRMLDELNSVVVSQQGELERLRREISQLTATLQLLLERTGENLPHEKPPHY